MKNPRCFSVHAGLLLGLLFLSGVGASGQSLAPLFDAPWRGFDTGIYPDGFAPKSIASGDLNADGHTDLVVGNWFYAGAGISVLKGLGNGTYAQPVRYAVAFNRNVEKVALADIDGDGDFDAIAAVAITFGTENSVAIWRNTGNGSFAAPQEFGTEARPSGLIVADFTGDQFPDVITANFESNSISVLRHNGLAGPFASFLPAVHFPATREAERLAAADLNGDGALDLVVGGMITFGTGVQKVLMNNGTGSFTAAAEYLPTPGNRAGSPTTALVDLDNDGDADLIGAGVLTEGSSDYSTLVIRRNNGSGTFGAAEYYRFPNYVWLPSHFTVADLNGDGFRDIIATTPSGRALDGYNVLLSNGSGGFHPFVFYHASQQTYGSVAVDVDHDGDFDVVAVAQSSAAVTVHKNRGNGTFAIPPQFPIGGFTEAQEYADVDNDGDLDIVTNGDIVRILKNSGDGTFAPFTTFFPPRNFADMKLRDLNGDGFPDLVLGPDADFAPYHFGTALNNGDGTFAPGVVTFVNSCGEGSIEAADLDGDGDRDIVLTEEQGCIGSTQQPRIFIYRNDGNQNFVPMVPVFSPYGFPVGIATQDVNRDGNVDLITSLGAVQHGVGVFPGNGNLTFGPPLVTSTRPSRFQVADVNRDGKLDVAMILPQPAFGTLSVGTALGNGDGTFQPVREQSGSSSFETGLLISSNIDVSDVDNDGDPDVIVTNRASNDVSVFLANGDGALLPHHRYGAGYASRFSSVADFTGDGVPDLATIVALPPGGFSENLALLRGVSAPAAPLQIMSAASRKAHGANTFDIDLPLTGEPAVECRSTGGAHTLVFTFNADVVSGSAQVSAGSATIAAAPLFESNTMTVNLSGVADVQTITVTLSNVTAATAAVLPNTSVTLHVLAGDITGNKVVNSSDIAQVKSHAGQPVAAGNFRSDVVVNGAINSTDVGLVKARAGSSISEGTEKR
jgi:hypothetical protein